MKGSETVSYKRSFLIGMILGDAHTRRRAKGKLTSEWTISHSESCVDLVEWKRDEFVRLFGMKPPMIHTVPNGSGKKCLFSLTAGERIRVVSQWFKRDGRKYITSAIRFLDHPVGLAMLLCDDGSIRKRKKIHKDGTVYYLKPSITIATHSFSLEEVKRLLDHLAFTFGVKGYINPERRWRRGERREYYRINFNTDNSKKLWKVVAPYMPQAPSMNAKFAYAYECFGHERQAPHSCFRKKAWGEGIVQTTNSV